MPLTPQITLTATLEDFTGQPAGSIANPAKLLIALCAFGPDIPQIPGTATIARIGPFEIASTGGEISTPLWGNDVVTPLNADGTPATYYAITVLDGDNNVVQCAAYQFVGTATIDLSNAQRLVQNTRKLVGAVPNGKIPGSQFSVPVPAYGGIGAAALWYNGGLQDLDDYELAGSSLSLDFETSDGDQLYIQYPTPANGMGGGVQQDPYVAIANGQTPGSTYTVPTLPPGAQFAGVFLNGGFQAPNFYSLTGQSLVLNFQTSKGDVVTLLYYIGPPLTSATSAGGSPTITGAFPGTVYTITTAAPANGTLTALFSAMRGFLRPGIDYHLSGTTITTTYNTDAGDSFYAFYL
jgi:hypothetical protein